jgi:SAM-dependent methyltransferase
MNESNPDISTFPLVVEGTLQLDVLRAMLRPPALFAPGAPHFWTDPHIAGQMLAAHLDPHTDAASRRPSTIDAEVDWLIARLNLVAGDRVLDLGCGPGLYCQRLAERGLAVTGVDASESSLAYARAAARRSGLEIDYRQQDYVTLQEQASYAAVLLIYYDIGVLSDAHRDQLLKRVHGALLPNGLFAFDVLTPCAIQDLPPGTRWSVETGGFWRPGPHLLFEVHHAYRDEEVTLRQIAIVEEQGKATLYRLWMRYFTPDDVAALLERNGFEVVGFWSDLAGTPLTPDSASIGVVARRLDDSRAA